METTIRVAQLLLSLTFLVAIHEWGHMFAAKRFGIWVEKFSIFFFPKIFGIKFSKDKFATEYCLGLIPLGGFVKIAGMMDESMDKEQLAQEPKPWEFRVKPAWQRLIVMLGGIIVNTVAGLLIFIFSFYYFGESYLPISELKQGIGVGEVAYNMGLRDNDKILNVNGIEPKQFRDLVTYDVLLADDMYYTVERDGKQMKISIPKDMLDQIDGGKNLDAFIRPFMPFMVDTIQEGSNADKAGLKMGDKILMIDTVDAAHFFRFSQYLNTKKEGEVDLVVERNGEKIKLTSNISNEGKLGFKPKLTIEYKDQRRKYSFFKSVPKGIKEGFGVVSSSVMALKKIFKGEAAFTKTFNSPVAMVQGFSPTWDWEVFWKMTGLFSMALAFMNLMPIPALDGGHVVLLLYEMISGKKPSDKFLENTQKVGVIILLTLMVVLFGKDIWALISG